MEVLYGFVLVTLQLLNGCRGYPWDHFCINNTFTKDVAAYCKRHPTAKLPVRDDCSAYYDCSVEYDVIPRYFSQYMKVCEYTELFDPSTETCQSFYSVSCCDRHEPKSPCEYRSMKCQFAHCQPCAFNRPSCEGLEDGYYPVSDRNNMYFQCFSERTVHGQAKKCPVNGSNFNMAQGRCVSN